MNLTPFPRRSPLTSHLRSTLLFASLASSLLLGACVPLVLGGALVGGSLAAIDRRSSGTQVDDQAIEVKSLGRIKEAIGDTGYASVTSYNRIVLITGEMPTEADKAKVGQVVARIDNVRSIVNEIEIAPTSSFANHSNDSLLTSKVKASLVEAKGIEANAFKVVTERGIVYLMGRVTEREATRASNIARGVSGVRKVVQVFEIISEAELADLQPKTAPAASSPSPRP